MKAEQEWLSVPLGMLNRLSSCAIVDAKVGAGPRLKPLRFLDFFRRPQKEKPRDLDSVTGPGSVMR